MASHKASCTGLTILLVCALRSVGIAARAVGTPLWAKGTGNHTWVEFHDGNDWHFTGASEQDPAGHDRGWFVSEAAKAIPNSRHAIYATLWDRHHEGATFFPMVWSPSDRSVVAEDVTHRYSTNSPATRTMAPIAILQSLLDHHHDSLEKIMETDDALSWMDAPLTRREAAEVRNIVWQAHRRYVQRERTQETLVSHEIRLDGLSMRFSIVAFGDAAPAEGRPVLIGLHGGGGAPAPVNDQQWVNHQHLYDQIIPKGFLYVCPRAPTNNWNLWHENHVDSFLARLIENLVALCGANPSRIYLSGYSAGGDGVYKLAPRMADYFAGASMGAGHPNGESVLGLRNLPFAIFVGAQDGAYDRNKVGRQYADELSRLAAEDRRGGYQNLCRFPNTGHWQNLAERESITWMGIHHVDGRIYAHIAPRTSCLEAK